MFDGKASASLGCKLETSGRFGNCLPSSREEGSDLNTQRRLFFGELCPGQHVQVVNEAHAGLQVRVVGRSSSPQLFSGIEPIGLSLQTRTIVCDNQINGVGNG